MKYTVEIWFGNVFTSLVVEHNGRTIDSAREEVAIVAERIKEKLGGDYCYIHCWEEVDD